MMFDKRLDGFHASYLNNMPQVELADCVLIIESVLKSLTHLITLLPFESL